MIDIWDIRDQIMVYNILRPQQNEPYQQLSILNTCNMNTHVRQNAIMGVYSYRIKFTIHEISIRLSSHSRRFGLTCNDVHVHVLSEYIQEFICRL